MIAHAPLIPTRVLIVDDHRSFAEPFLCALRMNGWREIETADSAESARRLHARRPFDIVVSDVSLPREDAFICSEALRQSHPAIKIVLLSAFHTDAMVERAVRARVRGYVLKTEPIEFVLDSLTRIASGETAFSTAIAQQIETMSREGGSRPATASLTKRQIEVLSLLAQGLTVKETAKRLFISPKSVESHKTRIMATLKLHNRVALTRFAVAQGLVTVDFVEAT